MEIPGGATDQGWQAGNCLLGFARLARNPITRIPVRLHRKPLFGVPLELAKWRALLGACQRSQNFTPLRLQCHFTALYWHKCTAGKGGLLAGLAPVGQSRAKKGRFGDKSSALITDPRGCGKGWVDHTDS